MMPSKYNRNDDDIKKVVNEWCAGPVEAEVKYGHISKWNTSLVTNMPRYKMLIEEIVKHTPQNHPNMPSLTIALEKVDHR